MPKRLLALFTSLLAALSLAACGSDSKKSEKPASTATTTTTSTTAATATPAPAQGTSKADKEAYIDKINQTQTDFVQALGKLSQAPTNVSDLNKTLVGLADRTDELADNIEQIKAPPEVTTEEAKLVSVVRSFAKTMRKQGAAVKKAKNDPAKLQAAAKKIQTASTKIGPDFSAQIQAINTKLGAVTPASP